MTSERVHKIKEKAVEEFRSFFVMALYLWFVFGLMMLNEAVILKKPSINFLAQGFAVINALVLAKVMLVADDLRFGRELDHLPLAWPILYKAVMFGLLFVVFHEVEHYVVGWFSGPSHALTLPTVGGGTWAGAACVWAIMSVSLAPFFAMREVSRLVGVGRVWRLMFQPGARAAFAAEEAGRSRASPAA
ncbi:MAG: hypothetical protein EBY18_13700 [Alphaproteobacteria bacterium]|nr:hypothetical protein [Alphaproteobacteria bacterium]